MYGIKMTKLKGGFGGNLYITESYLNIILDGGKYYFFLSFGLVKNRNISVFNWGATGTNLLGHQIPLVGSESLTMEPFILYIFLSKHYLIK